MAENFESIVQDHLARYPLMEAQDLGKLAFQSEFGPEHLVCDRERFLARLRDEWVQTCREAGEKPVGPAAPTVPVVEPIGGGLCRFHLDPALAADPAAAPLLTDLFLLTAEEHHGTQEGMVRRLDHLRSLGIPDMAEWLAGYERAGFPAVHHSQAFRDAYAPHYRVVRRDYGIFFPVLLAARRLAGLDRPAVLAIDGRCGSGKTTLAALVAQLCDCNVFHADDFYLPVSRRAANWREVPAGNMDLDRLRDEVLLPAREGRAVRTSAYDCMSGRSHPIECPARQLTVIEGSYCEAPVLAGLFDLRVFLTCSREAQLHRLSVREGTGIKGFIDTWIPLEERYHTACDVRARADVVIDTSSL